MVAKTEINKMYKELPLSLRKQIGCGDMSGEGFKDYLIKAKNFLTPYVKKYGPIIFDEVIFPLILQKAKEKYGVNPTGSGLKLSGQGLSLAGGKKCCKKPPHMVKGSQEAKDHMAKLRKMKKK